jgi:hypothetical protein
MLAGRDETATEIIISMATLFFARELINFLLFSPAKGLRRGAQLLGETKRVNGRSRCRHCRIRGHLHDYRKVRGKGCCVVIPGVCSWHLPSGARAPFPFHLDLHFLKWVYRSPGRGCASFFLWRFVFVSYFLGPCKEGKLLEKRGASWGASVRLYINIKTLPIALSCYLYLR